jgi:peptidoglycan/xylan/chitin deacetylase (PgdA/CDA1 family)
MSRGGFSGAFQDAWRKNSPELLGLWNGALPDFATSRRPREPLLGVPVFSYHLVEAETFGADLEFLKRNGYRTISSAEMVDYLLVGLDLPPRSVMLTFDDGPRNFHDVAFPLLRTYSGHATAFIAPGLHRDAAADEETDARPMSWEEISRVHASGLVDFQSHTLESRFVPHWPAPAALAGCAPALEAQRRGAPRDFADDLAASRQLLETRLPAAPVDQLAFPMYIGTTAAVETARSLGFRACYWGLVAGRPLNRRGDSPFKISRMSDEFVRRLPGERRVSIAQMLRTRVNRARSARAWRRRFA